MGWGGVDRDARTVAGAELTATIVLMAAGLMALLVRGQRQRSAVVGGG